MSQKSPDKTPILEQSLAEVFEIPSYEQWRQEAERLLKGAPFDKKMFTATPEGITLQSIYREDDIAGLPGMSSLPGEPPFVRGQRPVTGQWLLTQRVDTGDPVQANKALVHDLARGQTSAMLEPGLDSSRQAGQVLADIDPTRVPVFVECSDSGLANLAMLISAVREQGLATARLRGAIASDPLSSLLQRGHLAIPMSEALDHMAVMTAWGIEIAPSIGTIWVHGDTHHNAGATAVQELAATAATALYYLREMESRSLVPETVLPRMRFSFGSGTSFFMEIAKLRAARLLWQRLLEAANVDPDDRSMWMHVRTSRTGLSHLDAHTNLLRLTTGALAAAIAGADSIEVDPFDIPHSTPSEFSRRLARNTQVILADEVHLDTVTDPAGGCWYLEYLTHELARRGWEQFQQIEMKGGMLEAVRSGWWQEQIASVVKERRSRFAHRKEVLVGANKYPAPPAESKTRPHTAQSAGDNAAGRQDSRNDAVAKVLEELKQTDVSDTEFVELAITAATAGASSTAINNAVRQGINDLEQAPNFAPFRAAEPFEAIHSAVRNAAQTQPSLKAFVVGLGPVRNYMPRVDFAAGFLEVGGFEVARNLGFDTPEEAVKAFGESGCAIALVCGTDDAYAEDAANAAQMIRSSNSDALIVLAGLPGDDIRRELEKAGVEFFIHLGSDVPMTLSAIGRRLGVAL